MRRYVGNNGQEYVTPEDASRYGNGMAGYRDTGENFVKTGYTEATGNPVPESPVDHVIVPKEEIPVAKEEPKAEPIEIESPVEVVIDPSLEAKTDDELRAMCKERKFQGFFKMKRDTMLRKLSLQK